MHHIEVQLYYTNEAKQVIAIKFPSHMLCLLLHSYTNSNLYVISNDPQGAWATCAQEGALKHSTYDHLWTEQKMTYHY